jgi:hypothetical protein
VARCVQKMISEEKCHWYRLYEIDKGSERTQIGDLYEVDKGLGVRKSVDILLRP